MDIMEYTDSLDLSCLQYDIIPAKRRKKAVYDCVCAFDIETTRIMSIEQAVMWIWQFSINNDLVIYGRTWPEYVRLLDKLRDRFQDAQLVIYVFNLQYEFSFLKGIFNYSSDDIFAINARRVIKVSDDNIEYRCAYIHSNMSLEKFCESVGSEYRKLEKIDFTKQRFSYTQVDQRDLDYALGDVTSLVSAIRKEMENDKDNLQTIPLTSTGYIRRDIKESVAKARGMWATQLAPDVDKYQLLRNAFRGGNTHGNRFIIGKVIDASIHGPIYSYDRSSSYPDVQCNELFPIGRFYPVDLEGEEHIEDLTGRRGKALLFECYFENIYLTDDHYPVPYLSVDKCRGLKNPVNDNGRVMCADTLECTLTDIDWKIVRQQYSWDRVVFGRAFQSRYGNMPKCITDVVKRNYVFKTSLKGLELEEYFYTKSKNKLNSVYGCSAQNPVHAPIKYDPDHHVLFEGEFDMAEMLAENAPKMAMPYQFGVWTTAWARWHLELAIRKVFETPGAVFLYCDTDSVKFIGQVDFDDYNADRIKASTKNGAFAPDKDGNVHYMGVYEAENMRGRDYAYDKFCTLGAKKYVVECGGKLKLTVSGVNKQKGAAELKSIDNFKPGFIFSDSGKTEAVYNDDPEIKEYVTPDGITIPITSNMVIRETTYTLGIGTDFWDLVQSESNRYDPTLMV